MIKRKIFELELLRIFGAIGIVLYHLTHRRISFDGAQQQLFPVVEYISRYGFLGVNLFFMISGFVILMSAINRSAIDFAISRIDRLYPAYWAAVTATTICILIIDVNNVSLKQYLFNLTMLNDYFDVKDIDGVYWTLHAEIKFYFIIFLCILFKQLKNINLWLSIWLICCLSHAIFKQPFFMGWFISPFYSSYFIAGMSFYLIRKNGLSVSTACFVIVSYFISLFYLSQQVGGFIISHTFYDRIVAYLLVSTIFFIFYMVATKKTILKTNATVTGCSALTYLVFLLHARMGKLVFDSLLPVVNKFILLFLTIGFIFIIAIFLHFFVERRFSGKIRQNFSVLFSRIQ